MDAHRLVELQNDRQTAEARDNSRAKAYGNYPENNFSADIALSDGQTTIATIAYHDRLQWCALVQIPPRGAEIADLRAAIAQQTNLNLSSEMAWGEGVVYFELN